MEEGTIWGQLLRGYCSLQTLLFAWTLKRKISCLPFPRSWRFPRPLVQVLVGSKTSIKFIQLVREPLGPLNLLVKILESTLEEPIQAVSYPTMIMIPTSLAEGREKVTADLPPKEILLNWLVVVKASLKIRSLLIGKFFNLNIQLLEDRCLKSSAKNFTKMKMDLRTRFHQWKRS